MLSKSEELARELLTALSTELGILGGIQLLAAVHDRASVNGVAMRTLSIMYKFPTLDKFMKHWEAIFTHSKSKLLWKEQTGLSRHIHSPTRWWSRWECTMLKIMPA